MNIVIVGEDEILKNKIKNIVNDLNITNVNYICDKKIKYNIKHTPALIIDNVIVDEANNLTYKEMKNVIYQFVEQT